MITVCGVLNTINPASIKRTFCMRAEAALPEVHYSGFLNTQKKKKEKTINVGPLCGNSGRGDVKRAFENVLSAENH